MANGITAQELRDILGDIFSAERSKNGFNPDEILKSLNKKKSIDMSVDEAKRIQKNIESIQNSILNETEELKDLIEEYKQEYEKYINDFSRLTEEERALREDEIEQRENDLRERETEINNRRNNISKNEASINNSEKVMRQHWGKVSKNVSAITTVINSAVNMAFVVLNANLDRQRVRMQAANDLALREIKVYGNALSGLSKIASGNITRTTKENAYSSLDNVWETGKQQQIKQLEDRLTREQLRMNIAKINISEANALVKGGITMAGAAAGAIIGSVVPGIGTAVGAIVGTVVGLITSFADKITGLSIKKQELAFEQQKYVTEETKQTIEAFNAAAKPLLDIGKKVNDVFLKFQDAAYKQGRAYGLSPDQIDLYSRAVININKDLASVGMDIEDYYKMQEGFNENSMGRNSIISNQEALSIGGLSKRLNIETSTISAITGIMNEFNISIEDGSEMVFDMSNEVSKMGLNVTKFGKELVKNLKLAEKYQFKGGVRGVMEMSAWAQKMRVSMETFMGSIEKLHTGNIEDIIQTSARLNVLGGNAAILSDPMGMLYNAYADPEQYTKNIADMLKGFGTFNKKTGETSFNINEQMRMEAMASALGMSRGDFMNMARQTKKEQQIKSLYKDKFGDKTDFLTQNATWSQEKQDWIVKVKDGKGGFEEVGLNSLSGENDKRLNNIFPEDKQDRLLDYVGHIDKIMSAQEQQDVTDKRKISYSTETAYDKLKNVNEELAIEGWRHFSQNMNFYASSVNKFADSMLNSTKITNEAIENNKENLLKVFDLVNTMNMGSFSSLLDNVFKEGGAFNGAYVRAVNAMDSVATAIEKSASAVNAVGEYWYEYIEGKKHSFKDHTSTAIESVRRTENEAVNLRLQGRNREARATERAADYQRGSITGLSAHIGSFRDFIISPQRNQIIEPHPNDVIMGWKSGGPIDNAFKNNNREGSGVTTANLNITGTLTLSSGNQSIDLMEVLRNDPNALRELAKEVIIEGSKTTFGGKHQWAPNRYTFG